MKPHARPLLALLAAGLFAACVGADPDFRGGATNDDGGGDTGVAPSDGGAGDSAVLEQASLDAAPDATDAADAADANSAHTWTCTSTVAMFAPNTNKATNCSDSAVNVTMSYTATQNAVGDVSVTASVQVASNAPARSSQSWSAGTSGANDAEDNLVLDVCQGSTSQPGAFAFSLDKATNVLSVTYADGDLNTGSAKYLIACSETTP